MRYQPQAVAADDITRVLKNGGRIGNIRFSNYKDGEMTVGLSPCNKRPHPCGGIYYDTWQDGHYQVKLHFSRTGDMPAVFTSGPIRNLETAVRVAHAAAELLVGIYWQTL